MADEKYNGTIFEHRNIRYKLELSQLISPYSRFTDDTVITCAVAEGLRKGLSQLPLRWMEEAEALAHISAMVTHDQPDGIAGAQVVAGCIFLLRNNATKQEVSRYASEYYPLDFTLDEVREGYKFDVTCRGSVPQAIRAFLESENFTDVLANAISIGADSDTIAEAVDFMEGGHPG